MASVPMEGTDVDNNAEDLVRCAVDDICEFDFESEYDEIKKLTDMTEGAETHEGIANTPGSDSMAQGVSDAIQDEIDGRSVYVGNVDYSATPLELQEHFKSCGKMERITIMVDRYTGHPKGFAYIEFTNENGMKNSLLLSDTVFKDRQIKVIMKRRNIPGYNKFRGGYRGRAMASRGFRGRPRGGYRPYFRPRGSYKRGYGRPY